VHPHHLGVHQELDPFVAEKPLKLLGDVGILAAHELSPVLDHGDAAAEAAIGLREFEPHVTPSEHDEVCRQIIEFEGLDVRQRTGVSEPGHGRNGCARANVDEHTVTDQHLRSVVVQLHFQGLQAHELPGAHDQLGTAVLVVPQIRGDLVVDHRALPVPDLRYVDRDTPGGHAVICAAAHE
jgi:hypothetical protein